MLFVRFSSPVLFPATSTLFETSADSFSVLETVSVIRDEF